MTLFMTEIHVSDTDLVAGWYVAMLGLRIALRDEPKGFVLLESPGGGRIALKRSAGQSVEPSGVRLVFRVEDVAVERERLLELGVPVGEVAENPDEHYVEIRLVDPGGIPITIFSWSPR
jgi:catechol 2,3-dioxygenase-like lactoylglutathione lyase family enzyme